MSEFAAGSRRRRRRSDAERSVSAILDAARTLLGERPDATIADVAAVAGATRQRRYSRGRQPLPAPTSAVRDWPQWSVVGPARYGSGSLRTARSMGVDVAPDISELAPFAVSVRSLARR